MNDKINQYKITNSCIGCRACVNISDTHFAMNKTGKAVVTVQPKTKHEEILCADAALVCPVSAIVVDNKHNVTGKMEVNEPKSLQDSKKFKVPFLSRLRRV